MPMLKLGLNILVIMTLWLLTACGSDGGQSITQNTTFTLPDYMRPGNETYHETGGFTPAADAITIYIAYSPESQQYMPRIIEAFNRLSQEDKNPVTGQPRAAGEKPIFVAGQQPTSGSSGSLAQGIINAIIAPNNENVYHPTILQPSVSHWLAMVNYNTGREIFDLTNSPATALTPVVIGMWESRVRAIQQKLGVDQIGWDDLLTVLESPNGWCDYGIPNCRRAVYYGHTDPNISSTGLSATIAEFYSCARKNNFNERQLTVAAVNDQSVQTCVRDIENLVRHYSRRTEDFLEYISRGPDYLDFLALEETDLICLNRGAQQGDQTCTKPQERLIAIYPKEGTFWHEHPFGIVNADWVTPDQKAAAQVFTQFVLTAPIQKIIMSEGFRPANPDVTLEFPFVAENGIDVNQPNNVLDVPVAETISAIQQSWTLVKKRADIVLLMDISGSMQDEDKIGQAKQAANIFLDEMDSSNRVGLTTFNDTVETWVPLDNFETVNTKLTQTVDGLRADGSTALFDAIYQTVDDLNQQPDSDRIRAVVVLSDGADTASSRVLNDVIRVIEASQDERNPVIVIPVAYGSSADISTLSGIARASSTAIQSGDSSNISAILAIISSYF